MFALVVTCWGTQKVDKKPMPQAADKDPVPQAADKEPMPQAPDKEPMTQAVDKKPVLQELFDTSTPRALRLEELKAQSLVEQWA